jgi:hypothetical protein
VSGNPEAHISIARYRQFSINSMIHLMLKLLLIEDSKLIQTRLLEWLKRVINLDEIRVCCALQEAC